MSAVVMRKPARPAPPKARRPAANGKAKRLVSDDEYLAILAKNNGGFELVDGRLVELHMSLESDLIGSMIFRILYDYALKRGGLAVGEASYRLFPNRPRHYRRPDASFFWPKRLPGGKLPRRGYPQLAPDLVVEVVSPDDAADELRLKIREYFEAGVRLVWVVYPNAHEVHAFTSPATVKIVGDRGKLEGGDALPGFACAVKDFFAFPVPLEDEQGTND